MGRNNIYDKEKIIEAAVDFIAVHGKENYSVRNLAKHLQCSTQPIYSYFADSSTLLDEVLIEIQKRLLAHTQIAYSDHVFRNMGYGFTLFAKEYPKLFLAFFDDQDRNKEFVSMFLKDLRKAIDEDGRFLKMSSQGKSLLLEKMWTFSFGYAMLIIQSIPQDTSEEAIKSMILDVGTAIIKDALQKENLI